MIKTYNINKDKLEYNFNYNLRETNSIKTILNNKKDVTIDDLRRIALWKINRVLEISDELIERLNEVIQKKDLKFDDKEMRELILEFTKCKGVGFPMLSSFLKFLRPDIYPIIDVRAYRALYGRKIYQYQYSIEIYFNYIEKIYEIRDKKNIPLETIDEHLYEFDKKFNGTI